METANSMSDSISEMMTDVAGCFYGKYRGLVKSNQDPTCRGRLKVIVPAVMGEAEVWALPCVPYAGQNVGLYMMPEPGTGVWVEFEAGNPSYPIWSGCFWGEGQAPKNEHDVEAEPPIKIIRSQKDLLITLDDQKQEITIKGKLKVIVEAPLIELVENATHPVVFGDKLLQHLNQRMSVFNAHIHPGQTVFGFVPVTPAPPAPTFPAATSELISTKVKAG